MSSDEEAVVGAGFVEVIATTVQCAGRDAHRTDDVVGRLPAGKADPAVAVGVEIK